MNAEASALENQSQAPEWSLAIERHILAGEHRDALLLCAKHYARSVGRLCIALLGSQAEAEDATQEILIEAHHHFGSWRQEGSFKAWLFAIARRRCAKLLERRTRREHRLRLVKTSAGDQGPLSSEEWLLTQERAERARSALEALRPSEREALLLRYSAELSFREVGQACGVDEATARKRVSRALAHLRQFVQTSE